MQPDIVEIATSTARSHRHSRPSAHTHAMHDPGFAAPAALRVRVQRGTLSCARSRAVFACAPAAGEAHVAHAPSGAAGIRLQAMQEAGRGDAGNSIEDTPHRLSLGEQARTVVHVCRSGTLCTSSATHSGVPFGSHADYVLCDDGRPGFLLANGAQHTGNLARVAQCSLYCQPPATAGQEGCRATLVGVMRRMTDDEASEVRERYIETHAHAAFALQYPDSFAFYKMDVDDVFFVGGFGVVATWVSAGQFLDAQPDPLCFDAPDIVRTINGSREEDLLRLCRIFLGIEAAQSCTLSALDRLGFDLRVRDESGDFKEYRVAFREKVANRFDVQSALVKTFQEAWEREMGHADSWADDDERPAVMYYSVGR